MLGWWRLISSEIELRGSAVREPMYRTPPCGYLYFSDEGRMITVIEATGRARPGTQSELADAFLSTAAYTGKYCIEADRWTTHVDAAWTPWWTGTDQERSFRLESSWLHVVSAWYASPMHEGRMARACLTWMRGV